MHGVMRPGPSTVFPQAIALAATFDSDLMLLISTAISDEARAMVNTLDEATKYKLGHCRRAVRPLQSGGALAADILPLSQAIAAL